MYMYEMKVVNNAGAMLIFLERMYNIWQRAQCQIMVVACILPLNLC